MNRLIFITALFCAALLSAAQAKDPVCTGVNLMDKMRTEAPKKAASLETAANKLPFGKGLLWKVTKPGVAPSYIYGTIHLSDPRLTTLPPKAQIAFCP